MKGFEEYYCEEEYFEDAKQSYDFIVDYLFNDSELVFVGKEKGIKELKAIFKLRGKRDTQIWVVLLRSSSNMFKVKLELHTKGNPVEVVDNCLDDECQPSMDILEKVLEDWAPVEIS